MACFSKILSDPTFLRRIFYPMHAAATMLLDKIIQTHGISI